MRLVDMFEAVKGNAEEKLAGQISLTENWLVAKGYTSLKRESRGTSNTFYFKEGEPVVFVSYYSKNKESDNIGFTTMDKDFFDAEFRYTDGKVAFASRENGMKVIVSRGKTNKILCRLILGINSKNVCVDHKYHCIWLNDSFCIRPCTYSQINRNRNCSKRCVGDEFDYDAACDFSEKWWLVLCVTMFHELTWEQAKAYNMGGDVE